MSDYEELRERLFERGSQSLGHAKPWYYGTDGPHRHDEIAHAVVQAISPLIEEELRKRDEKTPEASYGEPRFPPATMPGGPLGSRMSATDPGPPTTFVPQEVAERLADKLQRAEQREAEARELLQRVSSGWIDTTFKLGRELLTDVRAFLESQKDKQEGEGKV